MKSITLDVSKATAFKTVLATVKKLDLAIRKSSSEDSYIELEYDGDLLSFGNKIQISFRTLGSKCKVTVSSRSSAALQIVDWGKNEKLEMKIVNAIKKAR